jgi:hypothetical protein
VRMKDDFVLLRETHTHSLAALRSTLLLGHFIQDLCAAVHTQMHSPVAL